MHVLRILILCSQKYCKLHKSEMEILFHCDFICLQPNIIIVLYTCYFVNRIPVFNSECDNFYQITGILKTRVDENKHKCFTKTKPCASVLIFNILVVNIVRRISTRNQIDVHLSHGYFHLTLQ